MTDTILIAEDDAFQAEFLKKILEKHTHIQTIHVTDGQKAIDYLDHHGPNVRALFMDLHMPVMDGMDAMRSIQKKFPNLPVVFLTASNDVTSAVDVMKLGALDYLSKPPDSARLGLALANALRLSDLARASVKRPFTTSGRLTFDDLVGHNGGLKEVVETARKIASSDIPVLIQGATGTGKEVFARAIHGESRRHNHPFVAINCGAIPESLIESTLFGHEKGAFTGATGRIPGKFREAENGTLFLDEIGEMPLSAQVRLLRALEQKEVQPLGSSQTIPVNVRVLSATNRNLAAAVERGTFREDLYFRLSVVPLLIPPLRVRPQDILPLAAHFIDRHAENEHYRRKEFSPEAKTLLQAHTWPGNVRELENAVRRAMVLSTSKKLLPEDFSLGGLEESGERPQSHRSDLTGREMYIQIIDNGGALRPLDQVVQETVERAYRHCGGSLDRTARELGIGRTTVYRKINGARPISDPALNVRD